MRHSYMRATTLTALTVVEAVLFAPASAAAQQKAQYACYVPGSGTVYRIKEPKTPSQCSAGHVEFQLSAQSEAIAAATADAQKKPGGGGSGGGTGTTAAGDLAGTYPNPTVVKIQGQTVDAAVPTTGQVLMFNNGAWTPTPRAATLPTTESGTYDFSNTNGILSIGTSGSGSFPSAANGPGARLLWFPGRQAFRAGSVDGTQWDNANVAYGSAALGANTMANGTSSFAAGLYTTASGHASTALGGGATASGTGATAFGNGATASALGATAMGNKTTASQISSVAMGEMTTASGPASLAGGLLATASGHTAVAIGANVTASGQSSVALGTGTTASGAASVALGSWASTNGKHGSFVFGDASGSGPNVNAVVNNQFVVRAQRFWLGTDNTVTATIGRFLETSTGAYLSTGGTWTNSSDVNRKHDFRSVDGEDVLAKIAAMPVTTWSYRDENSAVRHMGPTAQDFRSAFGLGDTDKAIATVDADGVSLAAIKALVERTTTLRAENEELRALLADVTRRLADLESGRR